MDMSQSIEPNSAQVNAEDLLAGPRTVTVTNVEGGTAEQPIFIHLHEFPGRTYRPSKTARRLIVACWGPEATAYTGRRLTLFRNPDITFGKERVGGIEVSHASHIGKPVTVALTVSRGKRKAFTITPLPDAPTPPRDESGRDWLSELALAADDIDAVRALHAAATRAHAAAEVVKAIYDKGVALKAAAVPVADEELI